MPSFSITPASTTEPAVGAWVWASGSQVCSGKIGTLTANATAKPKNSQRPVDAAKLACSAISTRSNVTLADAVAAGDEHGRHDRHEHERRADHRVEEELRRRVDATLVPPAADEEVHRDEDDLEEDEEQEQVEARNEPMTPASSSSSHAKYGLSRRESSLCGSIPRIASGNSTPVSRTRNSEMPSTPRCHEMPHCSIHGCFETNWKPPSACRIRR